MAEKGRSTVARLKAGLQNLLSEHGLHLGGKGQRPWWHRFVHFWLLVIRSFRQNRCPVRASALSYTTILALVPMLAVAMNITSGLLKDEGPERIGQFIDELVESVVPPAVTANEPSVGPSTFGEDPLDSDASLTSESPTAETGSPVATASGGAQDTESTAARDEVARQIDQFIQNTRGGAIGITGAILLIVVAISMLIRIEEAFNQIWGVLKGRTLFMRIVLYWTVITLTPVFLVAALGLASGPYLQSTEAFLARTPLVGGLIYQLLPVLILCVAFGVLYMLMPYTKVHWRAALVGGLIAGALWHLNSSLSVMYVSRVVTYSKIYGSLGLVPIFMIGLYFSWMILLFGCQVSYAWQNRAAFFQEKLADNVNQRGREFVALRLMTMIGARFQSGLAPQSLTETSGLLGIPTSLAQQVIETLSSARLLTEVAGAEPGYVPGRPLETISCHDILHAMRAGQGEELATHEEPLEQQIYGEFQRIEEAERRAASSVSVRDLSEKTNLLGTGASPPAAALPEAST